MPAAVGPGTRDEKSSQRGISLNIRNPAQVGDSAQMNSHCSRVAQNPESALTPALSGSSKSRALLPAQLGLRPSGRLITANSCMIGDDASMFNQYIEATDSCSPPAPSGCSRTISPLTATFQNPKLASASSAVCISRRMRRGAEATTKVVLYTTMGSPAALTVSVRSMRASVASVQLPGFGLSHGSCTQKLTVMGTAVPASSTNGPSDTWKTSTITSMGGHRFVHVKFTNRSSHSPSNPSKFSHVSRSTRAVTGVYSHGRKAWVSYFTAASVLTAKSYSSLMIMTSSRGAPLAVHVVRLFR
mmetsp:Transcript_25666/g.65990  ORF Transcript_25666/g.65990 Transcript_25666/m.65990 type:complete len:301 (+) Transcript_25666:5097-5999(+)